MGYAGWTGSTGYLGPTGPVGTLTGPTGAGPAGPSGAIASTGPTGTAFQRAMATGATFIPGFSSNIQNSPLYYTGLGEGATITPLKTGTVFVSFMTSINNAEISPAAGDGLIYGLYYGTGTAPAAGSAVGSTGKSVGMTGAYYIESITGLAAPNIRVPIWVIGLATGLAVGTKYWFDSATATNITIGSNFTFLNPSIIMFEVG